MPWHDDAFLLLPGDGFALLDAAGTVVYVDRAWTAQIDRAPTTGLTLREAWPELADHVDRVAASVADSGPVIVYVNDAFLRDSGYERHEVVGRSPRIMQPADVSATPRTRFRSTMEAWGRDIIEIENQRKDGSRFWVQIDLAPIADETGWFTHWVSVQQDITARKADEADREAASHGARDPRLPSVAERTARSGRADRRDERPVAAGLERVRQRSPTGLDRAGLPGGVPASGRVHRTGSRGRPGCPGRHLGCSRRLP
jgi:PAS domain S-box-containing protein